MCGGMIYFEDAQDLWRSGCGEGIQSGPEDHILGNSSFNRLVGLSNPESGKANESSKILGESSHSKWRLAASLKLWL
jgi:hypothetical protein